MVTALEKTQTELTDRRSRTYSGWVYAISVEILSTKDNCVAGCGRGNLVGACSFPDNPGTFRVPLVKEAKLGKISLNKSIEATKLHPRTEAPIAGPEVTIPFGALVESAGPSRDREKFRYLGELYSAAQDIFLEATRADHIDPAPAPKSAPPLGSEEEPATARPQGAKLVFEKLDAGSYSVARAKVPGGWLVICGPGITFYSDPGHTWDGTSLP